MSVSLTTITFDCTDAAALAAFWAELLGAQVDPEASPEFATIGSADDAAMTFMFTQVPDKTPGKNVIHLDLQAAELTGEIDRAVSLGAVHKADFTESGATWATLADPEGNLFDICLA